MTGKSTEQDEILVFGVVTEDRDEVLGEKNWTAPPVRDTDFVKSWMKLADSMFKRS